MPGKIAEVNPALATIDDVVIDDSGRFKYILCKVYLNDSKDQAKMIVRGTKQAEFHCKCLVYRFVCVQFWFIILFVYSNINNVMAVFILEHGFGR